MMNTSYDNVNKMEFCKNSFLFTRKLCLIKTIMNTSVYKSIVLLILLNDANINSLKKVNV